MSYAHSLGLTHGNINASNVYLYEGRHVLLGDFGLLWDVRALDPSWTGSDVAAFEYLAPEVFDGRVTPSADIYSLGATLFATLTGHAPFQAKRLGDLVTAARQQTPPSLAQESPPPAPPIVALDAVVRQAMAKQVEQRYPSAATLGQAIEAMLRQAATLGQAAQAAPIPAAPSVRLASRASRASRRGAAALGVGGSATGATGRSSRERRKRATGAARSAIPAAAADGGAGPSDGGARSGSGSLSGWDDVRCAANAPCQLAAAVRGRGSANDACGRAADRAGECIATRRASGSLGGSAA